MIPQKVLDKIDSTITESHKSSSDQPIIEDNIIISALCSHPELQPREIAEFVNEQTGERKFNGDRIINRLRSLWLGNPTERTRIIQTANDKAKEIFDGFNGDMAAYSRFNDFEKRARASLSREVHSKQLRCILVALFTKYSQLKKLPHADDVFDRGTTRAKACLLELTDLIHDLYLNQGGHNRKIENTEEKIVRIEERLKRSNDMLEELQNEFDFQLEESKTQELTNFFSALNSEKYGYILDGLFSTKAGLDELRRQKYELPLEINGLSILIRKLIQFVKDSGINPVKHIGDKMMVKSQDIENYIYLGSPFEMDSEEKQVEIISPGWIYEEKEIQVSRPTIKEIITEETK